MSAISRFISDLHFSHLNMAVKRGFVDDNEMNEFIIDSWNSVVNKRDTIYILGDITMEKSHPYILLERLNGIKKVLLGNHDNPNHVPEMLKYVNWVGGMYKYKSGIILTHCPIHLSEMSRFRYNIHGHVHENSLEDKRYVNVSCEVVNYKPKTLNELGIEI